MNLFDVTAMFAQVEVPIQDLAQQYGWLVAIALSIGLQVLAQILARRDAELNAQKIINQQFTGLTDENKKLRLHIVQKDKKIMELTLKADMVSDENLVLKGEVKNQNGQIERMTANLRIVEDSGIFKLGADGSLVKVGGTDVRNHDIITSE